MQNDSLPIVYSCSGCSDAAQMANYLAIQLDREQLAEMSCIAGVGGDVKKMVKVAKNAKRIIAIDGCPLACAKACLSRQGIKADSHYQLGELGVKKRQHEDFDKAEAKLILEKIRTDLKNNSSH